MKNKSLRKYAPIFLFPTLIAFSIAFVVPFFMALYLSFCEFTTVTDATFVGIENYLKAFKNADFFNSLLFTVKFAIIAVISVNIIAFILAHLLTRGMRGTNIFRTIFFMPNLIGGIVLGYTWQSILNAILRNYETTLVADPKFGFWGMVLLVNWQMIGYMMVIYIAGIQNIPRELLEASKIDGASGFQTLKNVTLPIMMPSITICLFLTISNCLKVFDQNLALTAGAPGKQTTMMALDIYNTFYGRVGLEGVGQAKAVIFFVIVAGIVGIQLMITRRKEIDQ